MHIPSLVVRITTEASNSQEGFHDKEPDKHKNIIKQLPGNVTYLFDVHIQLGT